jgi:hypothetical protein
MGDFQFVIKYIRAFVGLLYVVCICYANLEFSRSLTHC